MKNEGDALAPGTRVGQQFVVERFLGLGGFGVTYLVRDESLGVYRALKEYLPDQWGTRFGDGTVGPPTEGRAADYEWGLERFLHEARMLAQFRHPHIAQVHQVLEKCNGTAYMVMEYVEGRTLSEEVRAEGPLPESRVRGLLLLLAEGLSEVHAKELLHRDIKPDNVMIRRDGTPVLIDFGSARRAMGARSSEVTEFYAPHFTPIEQYGAGAHEDAAPDAGLRQGPWTDIYALGAVAYWALSGKLPLQAPVRALTDSQRPLRQLAPQVSEGLARAVESAMAVRPKDRPQSLGEWRSQLMPARVLERDGASASASGGMPFGAAEDEGRREGFRKPTWHWWLSGAAAAVVAVSAVWWFAQGSREPPAGTVFRECGVCPELVVIPAGEFTMGSPESEAGRSGDEGPQRPVRVELFALGRYEVTRAEYAAFARATGRGDGDRCWSVDGGESWDWRSPGFPQTDDHPAVCVSWDDASAYVLWLSRETSHQYRLPSESEWEYAARGGTSSSRYWGEGWSSQCGYANGADASLKQRLEGWAASCDDGRVFTAPVGTFTANRFGLFDMLGNVWEWVEDCWHDDYGGAPTDGRAWTSGGDCGGRVLRGGSWGVHPPYVRAAARLDMGAGNRYRDIGFRVARTLTRN